MTASARDVYGTTPLSLQWAWLVVHMALSAVRRLSVLSGHVRHASSGEDS